MNQLLIDVSKCFHKQEVFTENLFELERSVQESGIISPIIVRQTNTNEYEVIDGIRRLEIAKKLKIKEIQAIVIDCTEDEAEFIQLELKLHQKGSTAYKPSQLAKLIDRYINCINKQGRRTDLKDTVIRIVSDNDNFIIEMPDHSYRSNEKAAEKFEMSSKTIDRYRRLTYLIDELLTMVDDSLISIRAGVEISYLSQFDQLRVYDLLSAGYKLSMDKAKRLHQLSSAGILNMECIKRIILEERKMTNEQVMRKVLKKYKLLNRDSDEVEYILNEALQNYMNDKPLIIL